MRLLKLIRKSVLLILIALLAASGCASKQLVIYPIKGTDFCVKGDPECDMNKMDVGMSNAYFSTVLKAKIDNF